MGSKFTIGPLSQMFTQSWCLFLSSSEVRRHSLPYRTYYGIWCIQNIMSIFQVPRGASDLWPTTKELEGIMWPRFPWEKETPRAWVWSNVSHSLGSTSGLRLHHWWLVRPEARQCQSLVYPGPFPMYMPYWRHLTLDMGRLYTSTATYMLLSPFWPMSWLHRIAITPVSEVTT